MKNPLLIVFTTCPTQESASELARVLVNNKLAACVQISAPITSIYSWEGEVCESQEYQLQIKCTEERYPALEQCICKQHPYQVPEIIAVTTNHGLSEYISWVKEVTDV